MKSAYEGIESRRRFMVLVNPFGGKGKARGIYTSRVQPILQAAHCEVDMELTRHRAHATEIASSLELKYDAILTLSGDGLVHEVINGLGQHKDAEKAMQTPVVPIPTGSANGFCLNLLGLEDGWSVEQAVLNAIKGRPLAFDICSVTQNGKKTWSYFSQCVGLMADLDLGTENWRWMGDTRFILGYVRGVLSNKACPVKVSMKVIEQDKMKLVEGIRAANTSSLSSKPAISLPNSSPYADTNAGTSDSTNSEEGWWTFDRPISYIYAGTMPYVARDLLAFPCAVPSDGAIDLTVQELTTRTQMLGAIDGAERGAQFWMDTQRYFKVRSYRIEPLPDSTGYFSLDGEAFPFETFQVDIHPKMMRTMSIHGRFMNEFSPELPKRSESSLVCCK
jgi:sphingosine kinase